MTPEPLPWQPPTGPSTWGAGGPAAPPAGTPRPRGGTLSLSLGVVALVTSPVLGGLFLGVPALVLGLRARRRAARGGHPREGRATAGAFLGGTALVATVVFVAYVLSTAAFQDYLDCLDAAGTERSAAEQCRADLREDIRSG